MSQTFFIKPSPGAKVRDPVTKQFLAEEGENKQRDSYWLRRVAAGEVIVVQQPAAEAPKAAAKKSGE